MRTQLKKVRDFMEHMKLAISRGDITDAGDRELAITHMVLSRCGERLKVLASSIKGTGKRDARIERMQLLTEELAELADGLYKGSLVEIADAVTDMQYVLLGTALTFNLPLYELFEEVHRSNMTKRVNLEDPLRHNVKGEGYSPPDIARVLRQSVQTHSLQWEREIVQHEASEDTIPFEERGEDDVPTPPDAVEKDED